MQEEGICIEHQKHLTPLLYSADVLRKSSKQGRIWGRCGFKTWGGREAVHLCKASSPAWARGEKLRPSLKLSWQEQFKEIILMY